MNFGPLVLNIYPLTETNIRTKIEKSLKIKRTLKSFSLKSREADGWKERCEKFNSDHLTGFDIRTFSAKNSTNPKWERRHLYLEKISSAEIFRKVPKKILREKYFLFLRV